MRRKKIVVIGGGTGNFTVLQGLKNHPVDLSVIVSMADDGGSTGILRDELGVLPPGDVRQCLIALSNSSRLMRVLMNYRFENGHLEGHSFGNLFLSSLEKITGSFEKAVEEVGKILFIKGKVLPVTTHHVRLKMVLKKNDKILEGEKNIYLSDEIEHGYKKIFLKPDPKVNPRVITEIMHADLIIMSPGSLYTSIIPNLLVENVSKALTESSAKKVFIVNLMNRKGQTSNYKTSNYLKEILKFIKEDIFDYIIVNNKMPSNELIKEYAKEGDLVQNDLHDNRTIIADLLGDVLKKNTSDSLIKRSLIRHDSKKLGKELMKIVNNI